MRAFLICVVIIIVRLSGLYCFLFSFIFIFFVFNCFYLCTFFQVSLFSPSLFVIVASFLFFFAFHFRHCLLQLTRRERDPMDAFPLPALCRLVTPVANKMVGNGYRNAINVYTRYTPLHAQRT